MAFRPNIIIDRTLKDEFIQLENFKKEFERTIAKEIQPKMSDLRIIEEQKKFKNSLIILRSKKLLRRKDYGARFKCIKLLQKDR